MKTITTTWLLVFISITLLISTGCASNGKYPSHINSMIVEKIPSKGVKISAVSIVQEGSNVVVRGKLKRRLSRRGPIPGHIDIKVVGPKGKILEEQNIKHLRPSIKSRHAKFYFKLKVEPPKGSIIRISHHNPT